MAVRINDGIRNELADLQKAMADDDRNSANYYADDLATIIDGIDGKAVNLWRTGTWLSEQRENPLKRVPDVTLLEAAKKCDEIAAAKERQKQWFSNLDMDKALREVITDPSVLPNIIDGRHWAAAMKRLENGGYVKRVELVGPRGRASGHGWRLKKYQPQGR